MEGDGDDIDISNRPDTDTIAGDMTTTNICSGNTIRFSS